jgi:Response regulator receiver domain
MTIKVFLLDDHEVVRRGVRDLLEAEAGIEVIGEAGTAESALARIPALRPDVAVLDVRLPDGDGVSVCREIRLGLERHDRAADRGGKPAAKSGADHEPVRHGHPRGLVGDHRRASPRGHRLRARGEAAGCRATAVGAR